MLFWLFGLTLLNFIDRLLLELLVGSTAVGVYSSNYTIINNGLPLILTPIIQAVHPVVMDAWEGNNVEEIQDLLYEYTRYYFIIGIPSVVIFSILSYPLSHILLGRGFEEGYIVMPIVALGLFFWNLSMIGHKSYELKERTEIMSAGVFGAVIINICLNIPFIYYYGYTGAAIATLLSFLFYLVFAYLISHQEIPWKLPANSIINSSFSGILMTIPPMVLYLLDLHSYVLIIISAGVSIIIYIISMASTNEIEKEELKMMWKDKL